MATELKRVLLLDKKSAQDCARHVLIPIAANGGAG
jgi:hypothetical protein